MLKNFFKVVSLFAILMVTVSNATPTLMNGITNGVELVDPIFNPLLTNTSHTVLHNSKTVSQKTLEIYPPTEIIEAEVSLQTVHELFQTIKKTGFVLPSVAIGQQKASLNFLLSTFLDNDFLTKTIEKETINVRKTISGYRDVYHEFRLTGESKTTALFAFIYVSKIKSLFFVLNKTDSTEF